MNIIQNKSAVHFFFFCLEDFDTNDWCLRGQYRKPIGIMLGNEFSIFEAIDVWELWNQLPQICLLYHGRHGVFTIHQWVHVLNFFWSQILKVDTETPLQLVEEEHLQMMDFGTTVGKSVNFLPVSYRINIATTFSKKHSFT